MGLGCLPERPALARPTAYRPAYHRPGPLGTLRVRAPEAIPLDHLVKLFLSLVDRNLLQDRVNVKGNEKKSRFCC